MKRCACCNRELPLEAFGACKSRKDGLNVYCLVCACEKSKARYAAHHPKPVYAWQRTLAEGHKRCVDCGEVKPLTAFHRNRWSKDGLKQMCGACNSARVKRATNANKEAVAARRRIAYATRIDEMRARDKARRTKEGDARKERRRLAYFKNPELMRAAAIRWRTEHLEEVRRNARAYHKAHPDGQWARNAKRRASVRNAPKVERIDRQAIIDRDRSICGICGKHVQPADIHLDHIVPLFQGGSHTAANLRVTHRSCNLSRRRSGYAVQPLLL